MKNFKVNLKVLTVTSVLFLIAEVLMFIFGAPTWGHIGATALLLYGCGLSVCLETASYKLPKITLWSLLALGIVFIALFFLGGSNGSLEVAGDFLNIPRFSDAFLIWNYILFCLVVLITLTVVIVEFANNWKTNRKKAYMTLGVVGGFILLACVCWFLGSPEKINIIGYEGTDNEGAWAQMADAVIYACYFLVIATIGTMIWGYAYTKKLSK